MQNLIYRETPQKRKFGVELEATNTVSKKELGRMVEAVENMRLFRARPVRISAGNNTGWEESKDNNFWHVKYDSSCGWEVASFVANGDNDIDHIAFLAESLGAWGVEVNESCGFHVHVDISDFTERQVANLLGRWIKFESLLLFCCCDQSRLNNPYCRSLKQIAWLNNYINNANWSSELYLEDVPFEPLSFWRDFQPLNLAPHDNNDKKRTLNTVGYMAYITSYDKRRPTVELRMPECKLEARHVANWIRLFLNFVESSKKSPEPQHLGAVCVKEALYYLGLQENPLLILEPKLFDTKIWLLEKIIKAGPGGFYAREEAEEALAFISEHDI